MVAEFDSIGLRPYQLMCLVCRAGDEARKERPHADFLAETAARIRENPSQPLTLRCNATSCYSFQNPGDALDTPGGESFNRLRDFTVLQKLGLVPGATRCAIDLLLRTRKRIPSCEGVCGYPEEEAPGWPSCPLWKSGSYERGRERVESRLLVGLQKPEEKQVAKKRSVRRIETAERLRIRPHHLLCMTCFHGGKTREELEPIEEDNLYECIRAMQRDPDIPVELIEGPCSICPPCSHYHPDSHRCLGGESMALRDEKKDLDTLRILGLAYGDVVPARTLMTRLYERIDSTTTICGNGNGVETSPEWNVCGGSEGNGGYVAGRAAGLGLSDVAPA